MEGPTIKYNTVTIVCYNTDMLKRGDSRVMFIGEHYLAELRTELTYYIYNMDKEFLTTMSKDMIFKSFMPLDEWRSKQLSNIFYE